MNDKDAPMTPQRSPRLAVLIDADNTSPKVVDGLFVEVAKLGEASVRRIYGDFSDNRMKGWSDVLARHAIVPHQQFAYTTGKNASDITLVIDAMDLLHSGRFEGFCLVSSDSDFTRLASRIREQGLDAYGFGQQKTPEAFRQACKRFIFIENLMPEGTEAGSTPRKTEPPEQAAPLMRMAMAELDDDEGWADLGALGQRMQKIEPDFDSRTYGCAKLSQLAERIGLFEIDRKSRPMRLRLKPEAAPEPAPKPKPKAKVEAEAVKSAEPAEPAKKPRARTRAKAPAPG
jgi:uncharacterized LabA/DUF88 family protein